MKGSLRLLLSFLAFAHSAAWAEESRTWSVHHYGPRGDFHEKFRDIDLVAVNYTRAWTTDSGFEFMLSGGPWMARGTRWEPLTSEPPLDSDAFGIALGGGVRYTFPELLRVSPFVDASAQFLWAERPFPAEGSAVNGLLRWGGGFALAMGGRDSMEFGFRLAHVSNGGPSSVQNPGWNGEGVFLAWRRGLDD